MTARGPLWLVAAAALAGAGLAVVLWRELRGAGYRVQEETHPLSRWLVVVPALLPLVWAALAWTLGGPGWIVFLPAALCYSLVGLALTWIDIDVHRLPEGLTFPLAGALAALLVTAAAVTGDWAALGRAAVSAVACFAAYLVLSLVAGGALGFGDVVLGGINGLLLGWLGWGWPWAGALAAFAIGSLVLLPLLAVRVIRLRSAVPFGPFLVAGTIWTLLLAPAGPVTG